MQIRYLQSFRSLDLLDFLSWGPPAARAEFYWDPDMREYGAPTIKDALGAASAARGEDTKRVLKHGKGHRTDGFRTLTKA
jgi:hypothetical protein